MISESPFTRHYLQQYALCWCSVVCSLLLFCPESLTVDKFSLIRKMCTADSSHTPCCYLVQWRQQKCGSNLVLLLLAVFAIGCMTRIMCQSHYWYFPKSVCTLVYEVRYCPFTLGCMWTFFSCNIEKYNEVIYNQ